MMCSHTSTKTIDKKHDTQWNPLFDATVYLSMSYGHYKNKYHLLTRKDRKKKWRICKSFNFFC